MAKPLFVASLLFKHFVPLRHESFFEFSWKSAFLTRNYGDGGHLLLPVEDQNCNGCLLGIDHRGGSQAVGNAPLHSSYPNLKLPQPNNLS